MRRFFGTVAIALLALGISGNASAAVGPKGNAGHVRPWSVQFMNGPETVTLDQAVATAKAFNAIVALPKVYPSYVSAMKAANPSLQLYVYAKGMFTYHTHLAEAAYAHDASGSRIQGIQYSTWMLDPLSSEALAVQTNNAKQLLSSSGYDGVFLDTMGLSALNLNFVVSLPVNPTTGEVWTAGDWIKATAAFAGKIAAAVGKPVIANGLRDGRGYFMPGAESRVLLTTGLRGAMAESWLRGAANPIDAYPNEAAWKKNVDALVDAGARGASFLAVTKVWTAGTHLQRDAWFNFTAASFLLANDGNGYLAFTYHHGDATVDLPLYHVDLGSANGSYAKINGVYQRSFSSGRVLVNPSTSTFTVPLGATYHRLDGSHVTSVTLAPNTAQILTS